MTKLRVILLAAVVALGTQFPAHAGTGCSSMWLVGTYALQFSGTINSGAIGAGGIAAVGTVADGSPVAGVTRLWLDGAGHISGASTGTTYSFGGGALGSTAVSGSVTGTYTVADDCSITVTLTDPNGGIHHLVGAVVNAGGWAFLAQTDAGTGLLARLIPARSSCNGFELHSSLGLTGYGFQVSGSGYASVQSTGTMTLEPDTGNIMKGVEYRYAGTLTKSTPKGSLTINSDCTVSLKTGTATYFGVVSADIMQALLVQMDKGVAVAATLVVQ